MTIQQALSKAIREIGAGAIAEIRATHDYDKKTKWTRSYEYNLFDHNEDLIQSSMESFEDAFDTLAERRKKE